MTAASRTNTWAVGSFFNGAGNQTLIVHWNGKTWKRQPSSNPGGTAQFNSLNGVAAVSPTSAWAVGDYQAGTVFRTLALHCC